MPTFPYAFVEPAPFPHHLLVSACHYRFPPFLYLCAFLEHLPRLLVMLVMLVKLVTFGLVMLVIPAFMEHPLQCKARSIPEPSHLSKSSPSFFIAEPGSVTVSSSAVARWASL